MTILEHIGIPLVLTTQVRSSRRENWRWDGVLSLYITGIFLDAPTSGASSVQKKKEHPHSSLVLIQQMNLESVLDRTRQIIRRKHYSWNTEKVYCHWIERYSRHVCKLPRELSSEQKMERFLTCLARGDCSASTQNQAFNAILFLYNEVLERPLGDVRALRARRKPRVVTAPSRNEVARIFSEVDRRMEEPGDYPLRLIVKLLYGCGLRVSEPLNLRIKDVDLENSRLTIREAKGGKDRVVPLPCSLVPALQEQMKKAQKMWMRDRQREIPAPLPGALDRKYPNAGKSWAWYWLFPAHRPCRHPRTGTVVRWRVHEVNVQKVVREAAQKCGLESYVTPHVLRHAFATHSLQQGATVRDVQEVLGHASIETTMRYLHAATDRLRSPLDTLPMEAPVPPVPSRQVKPPVIQQRLPLGRGWSPGVREGGGALAAEGRADLAGVADEQVFGARMNCGGAGRTDCKSVPL
ncbi:MAG: integron integrase [Verrucomicrobiaceae bacterium]|nr:MAG: integron integrase [Verrucomicrobiaceae bacterium]